MCLSSIAFLKSISIKINIYWYVLSTLLKKLLQSRALVLLFNYTKGELPPPLPLEMLPFYLAFSHLYYTASLFFLNHAIHYTAPVLFSDSESRKH